jgi:hypothetical protein
MEFKKELLAPCGLYCGVCAIMIAHRDNNQKFKERLAKVYGVSPAGIRCKGCLSDEVFAYCATCPIKSCTRQKGYEGCHECNEFPCEHVHNFPVPVGKKVILRAIPQRREMGTEKWVEAEEKRYQCPHCGNQLFRGAQRCRNCGQTADPD